MQARRRHSPRLATMYSVCLFITFCISLATAQVQFCHVDKIFELDLCLALSTAYNSTSKGYDHYMTFSGRYERGRGWNAVGIGEKMDKALMFVLYPGREIEGVDSQLRSLPMFAFSDP